MRRTILERRLALPDADRSLWSQAIQSRALAQRQYIASRSVVLYSPIQNEVDTRVIQMSAFALRQKLFYPKSGEKGEPWVYQVRSPADLRGGRLGIPEPACEFPLSQADAASMVVFVPGVLFDPRGNRLGRGGGWYDRLLARLDRQGVYIGLAYEFQVVDQVEAREWDKRVHFIITENRVIDCCAERH